MFFDKNINVVWSNIVKYENETFTTKTGKNFVYVVYGEYILVNDDKRRKITKDNIEKALLIKNPTPQKIAQEGIWANSYIYGIITDNRIKSI